MKIIILFIRSSNFILFLLLFASPINAQKSSVKNDFVISNSLQSSLKTHSVIEKLKKSFDDLYGLDYELYNGKRYYPTLKNDSGTPFWQGNQAKYGKLVLNENSYDSLLLLYEVYNHEFILEYYDLNENIRQLVLIDERIDTVVINQAVFIKNNFPEIDSKYIQLAYLGKISCYFSWQKEYLFKSTGRFTGYQFSEDIKITYLDVHGNLVKYTNNKSFLKAFGQEKRKLIRNYISKNRLKVKKAGLNEIQKLIAYCNTLY